MLPDLPSAWPDLPSTDYHPCCRTTVCVAGLPSIPLAEVAGLYTVPRLPSTYLRVLPDSMYRPRPLKLPLPDLIPSGRGSDAPSIRDWFLSNLSKPFQDSIYSHTRASHSWTPVVASASKGSAGRRRLSRRAGEGARGRCGCSLVRYPVTKM